MLNLPSGCGHLEFLIDTKCLKRQSYDFSCTECPRLDLLISLWDCCPFFPYCSLFQNIPFDGGHFGFPIDTKTHMLSSKAHPRKFYSGLR